MRPIFTSTESQESKYSVSEGWGGVGGERPGICEGHQTPADRPAEARAERSSVWGGLSEPAAQSRGPGHLLQVRDHGLEVEGPQAEGAFRADPGHRAGPGQVQSGSGRLVWEEVGVWIFQKYFCLVLFQLKLL